MGSKPVRVLAVEDNPADLRLLKEQLGEASSMEFDVTGVETLKEAIQSIPTGEFAVVLLDLNLPDSFGLDGIGKILALPAAPPVIVLTGLNNQETGLQALSRNAQDYLIKGQFNSDMLIRSIRYAIQRDLVEKAMRHTKDLLEIANRELQQSLEREQLLARTDGLTGLYNARHFFELANRELSAALRYQYPLTILMFDADGFKQINDIAGHKFGDNVLIRIAQTTSTHMRAVDVLARYGGDEFVILLPQTNAQQALQIAERIRESTAAMRLETEKGTLTVMLSIGIAEAFSDNQGENIETIIQHADKALYMAKAKGRNRTMIYSSQMQAGE